MKAYSNKTARIGAVKQKFTAWIKGIRAAKKAARQEGKKICIKELEEKNYEVHF